MTAVFLFVFTLYCAFLLAGIYQWHFSKNTTIQNSFSPSVSIIIAARNEVKNLPALLASLDQLIYDRTKIEIIFVDDFSTDNTAEVIRNFESKSGMRICVFKQTLNSETPKKEALKLGIKNSSGDILLFTDADCTVQESWAIEMTKPFIDPKIELAVGCIKYFDSNFLEKLLSIEQAALLGAGFTSLQLGIPSMCNGANMAIRRSTFDQINGFETASKVASGDDELLLHKVFLKNKNGITFIKSAKAIVSTLSAESISQLFHQRKRWAGKWDKYLLFRTKAFAVAIFAFHLIWLCVGISILFSEITLPYFSILFIIKMTLEFVFIASVMKFLNKRINLLGFALLQFIYSPYVVFFGLIARTKKYNWKERELS